MLKKKKNLKKEKIENKNHKTKILKISYNRGITTKKR